MPSPPLKNMHVRCNRVLLDGSACPRKPATACRTSSIFRKNFGQRARELKQSAEMSVPVFIFTSDLKAHAAIILTKSASFGGRETRNSLGIGTFAHFSVPLHNAANSRAMLLRERIASAPNIPERPVDLGAVFDDRLRQTFNCSRSWGRSLVRWPNGNNLRHGPMVRSKPRTLRARERGGDVHHNCKCLSLGLLPCLRMRWSHLP